jgi:hypothetical protein
VGLFLAVPHANLLWKCPHRHTQKLSLHLGVPLSNQVSNQDLSLQLNSVPLFSGDTFQKNTDGMRYHHATHNSAQHKLMNCLFLQFSINIFGLWLNMVSEAVENEATDLEGRRIL